MDKPNYFGLLPAKVRYCQDVSDFAKVLFAEVTALSNKNGFCNAKNSTFAELFGKSETTISKTLSILDKAEFIKVDIERNSSGTFRKIYPLIDTYGQKLQRGLKKTSRGVEENDKKGLKKTSSQKNNTSINITSKNKSVAPTPKDSKNWTNLDINLHNFKIPFSEKLNQNLYEYWKYMEEKKGRSWGTTKTIKLQVEKIEGYLKKFTEKEIIESLLECQEKGNASFNPQWTKNRKDKSGAQNNKSTYSFNTKVSNAGPSLNEDGTPSYMMGLKYE
jgi:hypothetical protein